MHAALPEGRRKDPAGLAIVGRRPYRTRVTPEPRRPVRPRAARRSFAFLLGSTLVGSVILAALSAPMVGPLFAPDPYTQVAPRDRTPPTPPDRDHPFGTDAMGRDLVSRVLYGARLSLVV